jgi:hypothetical protein
MYMIFNVSELNCIDFSQILETSIETIRKSVDGTESFIKWENQKPSCIDLLTTAKGPYTKDEMLTILNTPEWSYPKTI